MFDLTPINEVVEALRDAGIRADLDPAKVNLPGVWVWLGPFQVDTLATYRNDLRLQLLVKDTHDHRAFTQLLDLARKVNAVIPVRTATPRQVPLPDGNPLPALEVPFTVRGDLVLDPPTP
jgi:hypothetical protein